MTRYSGEYDCEIEADSDRPISVTHKLDILIPPQIYSEPADGNIMIMFIILNQLKKYLSPNICQVTWL